MMDGKFENEIPVSDCRPLRKYEEVDRLIGYKSLVHSLREALTFRLAHQTDIDFPIDVPPFLCFSKRPNQILKGLGMLRSVFKPRQKVEGFADIAAMVKLPCDGRQIP